MNTRTAIASKREPAISLVVKIKLQLSAVFRVGESEQEQNSGFLRAQVVGGDESFQVLAPRLGSRVFERRNRVEDDEPVGAVVVTHHPHSFDWLPRSARVRDR